MGVIIPITIFHWRIMFHSYCKNTFSLKRCTVKFCKIHRKTPKLHSFFSIRLKAQACNFRLSVYLKRDSTTGVLRWILQNFTERFFYRAPPANCFWISLRKLIFWVFLGFSQKIKFYERICSIIHLMHAIACANAGTRPNILSACKT